MMAIPECNQILRIADVTDKNDSSHFLYKQGIEIKNEVLKQRKLSNTKEVISGYGVSQVIKASMTTIP